MCFGQGNVEGKMVCGEKGQLSQNNTQYFDEKGFTHCKLYFSVTVQIHGKFYHHYNVQQINSECMYSSIALVLTIMIIYVTVSVNQQATSGTKGVHDSIMIKNIHSNSEPLTQFQLNLAQSMYCLFSMRYENDIIETFFP